MPLQWVKIYCLESLDGSIRRDLEPSERSVWYDLLLLAGLSRRPGYIERSKGIPYTIEEISSRLSTGVDIVTKSIEKSIKEGRITKLDDGTLVITNWGRYQVDSRKEKTKDVYNAHSSEQSEAREAAIMWKHLDKHPEVEKKIAERHMKTYSELKDNPPLPLIDDRENENGE